MRFVRQEQVRRPTWSFLAALFSIFAFTAANGASYTSQPVVTDFSGWNNITMPDGDSTFGKVVENSGWLPFGTSSNPLPALLQSIDANFYGKYRVDGLTVTVNWVDWSDWRGPPWESWVIDIGDGVQTNGSYVTFRLDGFVTPPWLFYNQYTIRPDQQALVFQTALDASAGAFQFRLRDTGTDWNDINPFNVRVVVNYSDAPPVPEPSEWMTLMIGLTVIGYITSRRKQKMR